MRVRKTKRDNDSACLPLAAIVCESEQHMENNDESADHAELLAKSLGAYFRVLSPIRRGSDIWPMLFNEIPAIIVVSQTLRDIDAINLIRSLRSSSYCTDIRFFLCCKSVNKSVASICEQHCIDGAFSVSDPPDEVAATIHEVYDEYAAAGKLRALRTLRSFIDDSFYFSDPARELRLSEDISSALLAPLGLDPAHKGTEYVKLIILMQVCGVNERLNTLYGLAASYFNTTDAAVEKAIRYSIERAWEKGRPYMQYYLFGNTVDEARGKPTNAEFIATITEHVIENIIAGYSEKRDLT